MFEASRFALMLLTGLAATAATVGAHEVIPTGCDDAQVACEALQGEWFYSRTCTPDTCVTAHDRGSSDRTVLSHDCDGGWGAWTVYSHGIVIGEALWQLECVADTLWIHQWDTIVDVHDSIQFAVSDSVFVLLLGPHETYLTRTRPVAAETQSWGLIKSLFR